MAIANPEVEFHLHGFIDECVEMLNGHYKSKFSNLKVPEVKVYPGSKYYKIAKKDSYQNESVWFFVGKEDGLIWKAASWKTPAKNFPRGCILEDKAKDVIGIYGL
tara:strand:- start:528 stop:842 length:315 start_codon:yes stop_codon:yes gene_type:complete